MREMQELGEAKISASMTEAYFASLIKTIIYSAMYMRIVSNPIQSLNILDKFRPVSRKIEEKTTNPLLFHLLARYYLTLGIIHIDMGKYENSKECLINSVALFVKECEQRLKYVTIISMMDSKDQYELKRMVDLSICLFYNIGIIFQEKKCISLFCYRYCKWLCINVPCISKDLHIGYEELIKTESENFRKEVEEEKKQREDEKNKIKATAYDREREEFMGILNNYNINSKFTSIDDTGDTQSARLIQNLISKGEKSKSIQAPSDINDIARNFSLLISSMKPQNETYIKTKCPNLIQTYMCDFQEALENQKRKKKPEIDLNVEDSEELDKSPLTPMPIKCKKEKGKNVMNPDDYFKELICKALKIDVKNLHEPYFKKFLTQRKHNVAKIMESKERKELKFCKDLLKMKHKEVALKAGIEKDKGELKMSVQTDVAFRIYRKAYGEEDDAKINENNALTRKGKTPKSLKRVSFSPTIQVTSTVPTSPIRALPKRLRPSTSTSSNFLRLSAINTPVKVDPLKVEQENKRVNK